MVRGFRCEDRLWESCAPNPLMGRIFNHVPYGDILCRDTIFRYTLFTGISMFNVGSLCVLFSSAASVSVVAHICDALVLWYKTVYSSMAAGTLFYTKRSSGGGPIHACVPIDLVPYIIDISIFSMDR